MTRREIARLIKRGGFGQVRGDAGMSTGESEIIECRPTKWFYLRAVAMVGMFAVFFVLFLKDWKVGWPKKNEIYYTYQAFKAAEEAFRSHQESGQGAESWKAFVGAQKIPFPDEEGVLPAKVDRDAAWPELLGDYEAYKAAAAESKATEPLWSEYTDERGWPSGIPPKSYDAGKIRGQLYWGIGSGVLMLVGVYFLVRTSRRTMKVDDEAFHAPGGERVAFDAIRRIDKRKWETKGMAYLYVGEGEGALKKVKVDGMVYGQFKAEDGAPAGAALHPDPG